MTSKIINTILNLKDNFSSKLFAVNKNMKEMTKEQKNATAEMKLLVKNFKSGFEEMEQKVKNFAKIGVGAAVTGTVALAKSSLDTFKEFEQTMANTAAIAGKTQGSEEYKALEEAARAAGKATSKTAKEAAEALGYMSLAGWDVKESTEGLMPILRMSEATQADLATTSDLVTDTMSALGIGVSEMPAYLDKLIKANNKSNQTAQQLMEAYINVGGTFKSLGTETQESAALLGVLANRGLKGSEAGNSLSSTLINLKKKSGESYEAMKMLGLSAFDTEGNFKGVTKVLKELNEKTKNLTQEQRDMYFTMIGGKTNIETLNKLMDGLNKVNNKGVSELEELTEEIANSDGALQGMTDTVTGTTSYAFEQLKSAMDDFKIMIGTKISPYVKSFVKSLADELPKATEKLSAYIDNKIIPSVSAAIQKFKEITAFVVKHKDGILGTVKVLGKLYIGYKAVSTTMKLADGIKNTISTIKRLKDVFGSAAGVIKAFAGVGKLLSGFGKIIKAVKGAFTLLNTTLLASPITWIVVGITAVVVGFVLLYKKCETFRNAVNGLWGKIKEFFTGLMPYIIKMKDDCIVVFNAIVDAVKLLADLFKTAFNFIVEKVKPVISAIIEVVKPYIFESLTLAFEKIKIVTSTFVENIKVAIETIVKVFSGLTGFIAGVLTADWEKAWQGLKDVVSSVFGGIAGLVTNTLNGVIKLINTAFANFGSFKVPDWDILPNSIQGKSFSFPVIPEIQMPSFALGTQYFKGGLAEINERGGEIVNLPNGSKVIPADKSEKILNKNNDINITVNIQGNVIGNEEYVNKIGEIICRKVKMALSNT